MVDASFHSKTVSAEAAQVQPVATSTPPTLQQPMPQQSPYLQSPLQHTPSQQPGQSFGSLSNGLPVGLKSGMEQLSGCNLNDVQVHYHSPEPIKYEADAYAQGNQIHLSSGAESLLPHEAWHVVQQKQGRVSATTQFHGAPINEDDGLEREADIMGARALQISANQTNELTGLQQPSAGREQSLSVASNAPLQLGRRLPTKKHKLNVVPRYKRDARRSLLKNLEHGSLLEFGYRSARRDRPQGVAKKHSRYSRPEKIRADDPRYQRLLEAIRKKEAQQRAENTGDYANAISEQVISALQSINLSEIQDQSHLISILSAVQEHFPVEILDYQPAEDNSVVVTFNINPTYQVKLKGTQRIGLQMLGTDSSSAYQTKVQWLSSTLSVGTVANQQVGWKMYANPISQDHQKGMIAGKNTDQDPLMQQLAKQMGTKETKYIKGHLLNDHLGGPALADNLFPITDAANAKHLQWVEKYVKGDVAAGYVGQYSVVIDPQPSTITPAYKTVTAGANNRDGYTVDSTMKCEYSRLNISGNPIPQSTHKVDIASKFGQSLSGVYDPTKSTALNFNNRYGVIHEGGTNPSTVGSLGTTGANKEATYAPGGYTQSKMHTAVMSDVALTGATFNFSSFFTPPSTTPVNLRMLNATQIRAVVGRTNTANNIRTWLNHNSGPYTLEQLKGAVVGVGDATLTKMKAANWVIS